jgi:hypothetical protein
MPGLTLMRILISLRIRASRSPNLLEQSASILPGPIFTAAALQLRHTALCTQVAPVMDRNRALQATASLRVLDVWQLDLPKATIFGRVLDATSARWLSEYISSYLANELLMREENK